jgi:hypothetical protein
MKLDLIEIANVPYRNHKAEIYSANVRKRYKHKGIINSILLALVFGIFFGFCHIKSVASSDSAEIITPRLVEMTYYLPTGNNCANTLPPHEGIVAFAPEYIGDTAIIYESDNGKIGDLIGFYEIYDTGFGKYLDGIGSSIKAGKTIDVYFEHDADGKEFIKEHGNEVFIQVLKAQG